MARNPVSQLKNSILNRLKLALCYVLILEIPLAPVAFEIQKAQAEEHQTPSANCAGNSGCIPEQLELELELSDPSVQREELPALQVADTLEAATEGSLPPPSKQDAFGLAEQTLIVYGPEGKKTYPLGRLDLTLPNVSVPDAESFEQAVQVVKDPATGFLALQLRNKKQELTAEQVFTRIRPLAWARDQEILTILTDEGKLLAFDMGFAREGFAFTTPLPIVELKTLDSVLVAKENIKLAYLSRGLKPLEHFHVPSDAHLPQGVAIRAGDLAIFSESSDGARTLLDLSNREVMHTQLYTAESVLAFLMQLVNPAIQSDKNAKAVSELQSDDEIRKQTTQLTENHIDPAFIAAARALDPSALENLVKRAKQNLDYKDRKRDTFGVQEWADSFKQIQAQVGKELEALKSTDLTKRESLRNFQATLGESAIVGDFSNPLKTLLENRQNGTTQASAEIERDHVAKKSMIRNSLITLGAIASGSALVQGAHAILAAGPGATLAGHHVAWAYYAINSIYLHFWPHVLVSAVYGWPLLASSLSLGSFIFVLWGIGKWYSAKEGKGWDAWKGTAALGMRLYATLQLPFFHYLAKLTRQPNFIKSMQLGINPLSKVKKDSPIGKSLNLKKDLALGVSNPFGKGLDFEAKEHLKKEALTALATQKARVRSLAWILAALAVYKDTGVDPATLTLTAESADLSAETLAKISSNPALRERWTQTAKELQFSFATLNKAEMEQDLAQISFERLNEYWKVAKATATKVKSRDKLGELQALLRNKWKQSGEIVLQGLGNYGLRDNEILRTATPTDDISRQFAKQFIVDYSLGIGQMGFLGARAELNHPENLAAQGELLSVGSALNLWTNPAHKSDMLEQVIIYGVKVPASMVLTYQKMHIFTSQAMDPIEWTTGKGVEKTQSYGEGMLDWMRGVSNLKRVDFDKYSRKGLMRQLTTFQAALIMSLGTRILLGHQSAINATFATIYGTLMGYWSFAWLWTPVNRGNQIYEEKLEDLGNQFRDAKTTLSQGLRTDDLDKVHEGSKSLMALFNHERLSPEISGIFKESKNIFALPAEEIAAVRAEFSSNADAVGGLQSALLSGNADEIQLASQILRQEYERLAPDSKEAQALLIKLNGASLLQFALKNPPFATKSHHLIEWTSTLFGALLTTYWYTSLSVFTFAPHVAWPLKIAEAVVMSASLYISTFVGQRIINRIYGQVAKIKKSRADELEGLTPIIKPLKDEPDTRTRAEKLRDFFRRKLNAKTEDKNKIKELETEQVINPADCETSFITH